MKLESRGKINVEVEVEVKVVPKSISASTNKRINASTEVKPDLR